MHHAEPILVRNEHDRPQHWRRFLAALCFMAGQPGFAFLTPDVAKFAGIGLTMTAGIFWAFFGFAQRSD